MRKTKTPVPPPSRPDGNCFLTENVPAPMSQTVPEHCCAASHERQPMSIAVPGCSGHQGNLQAFTRRLRKLGFFSLVRHTHDAKQNEP